MTLDKETDVLIIGGGIAGASCALVLADLGKQVLLINKMDESHESNTRYAQGGIVARGEEDSPELLMKDILLAGDHIGHEKAIEMISEDGPDLVYDFLMNKVGVDFTKDEDDNLLYTSEAVHSVRRVLYVKDYTGKEIIEKLHQRINENPNITVLTNHVAIDLITSVHHSNDPHDIYNKNKCLGAYVFDNTEKRVIRIFSPKTVMASGGVGSIYLYTSNPSGATGDGISMSHRAGVDIINAEYVQFHPTTLFHKDVNRFLISESLRGEGGRLKNLKGEYFMENYDPLKDLAPRDVISRAIYEEILKSGHDYVYLDMTELADRIDIPSRFPTIYDTCKSVGVDITKEAIPVVPAAHYFCGGIKVDIDGKCNLSNLYAVGETACTGVHGANRLASVSLLEGLVWGIRTAKHIAGTINVEDKNLFGKIKEWQSVQSSEEVDPVLILQDWLSIKTTMWNYAGIVRTKKRLKRAYADLQYLAHRIERFYQESTLSKELIELRHGIIASIIIVRAALRNERSIGCHHRKN